MTSGLKIARKLGSAARVGCAAARAAALCVDLPHRPQRVMSMLDSQTVIPGMSLAILLTWISLVLHVLRSVTDRGADDCAFDCVFLSANQCAGDSADHRTFRSAVFLGPIIRNRGP